MSMEIIISCFALLVSIIVVVYSFIQGRKSNQLQERIVNIEEQREKEKKEEKIKAEVKAEVVYRKTAKGKQASKFRVYNQGAGAAQNVKIFIDDKPVKECDFVLADQNEYEIIAAGSEVKIPVATSKDSPSNWKTVIHWDDKTGTDNEFETILTK